MTVLPAPAAPVPSSQSASLIRPILSMLAAIFLFSSMSTLVKLLGDRYPVSQIVFCRAFFALFALWPMIAAAGGIASLRTARPWSHVARCTAGVTAMGCGFTALVMLPLANAAAPSFTAPLFVTILGVLILGERLRWRRTLALCVGFAGVLVMLSPKLAMFGGGEMAAGDVTLAIGSGLSLIGAFFAALAMISIRRLSTTEPSTTIVFYFMVTACLVSGVLLPFQFVMPTPVDAMLLVAIGLLGGVGQLLLTQAYRGAPVAVIAPLDYTAMIWATGYGFLIWGTVPEPVVIAGALIVVASGVYITLREVRLGLAKPTRAKLRGDLP